MGLSMENSAYRVLWPAWEVSDIWVNFENLQLHLCPGHLQPFLIIRRACEHRKDPT